MIIWKIKVFSYAVRSDIGRKVKKLMDFYIICVYEVPANFLNDPERQGDGAMAKQVLHKRRLKEEIYEYETITICDCCC